MKKILIIGGGIGGLTTGIALRQAGFEIEIFERAPELREVGAGIALSPNAMRVLDYLGLMADVVKCSSVLEDAISYTYKGEIIGTLSLKLTDLPTLGLHRAELQNVLLSAIPRESLHLGHELVRIQNSPNSVTAHFANGQSVSGDALIGADGFRSRARAELIGDGNPTYRGYQCWRGVTSQSIHQILTETFGLGVRVGVVPIGSRGTAWWCTANEPESETDGPGGPKPKLLKWLENWHDPIPRLIAGTDSSAIIKTGIYDRPSLKGWSDQRCTLLGDAAHPTTPNMGQGACMAIEDAVVVTRCLKENGDPATAFQKYEKLRYSRTTLVTRLSRYYGVMGQWERPLAAWARQNILKLGSGKSSAKGYVKFVNYDSTK